MQDPAFTFAHHTCDDDQLRRIENVRKMAVLMAKEIEASTPPCADQSAAIRKLRESVMTANAAIATNGRA